MVQFTQVSDKPNLTTLVMPVAVGFGVRKFVETIMLQTAGGFTSHVGKGGWRDEANHNVVEDVIVYSVANLPFDALEQIAEDMLTEGEQHSVYAVLPDGRSGLFETAKGWQNGVSPGSDYPDEAWGAKHDGNPCDYCGEVYKSPVSDVYNTPQAYEGTLT